MAGPTGWAAAGAAMRARCGGCAGPAEAPGRGAAAGANIPQM